MYNNKRFIMQSAKERNQDLLRYRTLIQNLNDAVLVEDENRTISLVNQAFCDLFQIPVAPQQLIGADCSNSASQAKALFVNPETFVDSVESALQNKTPIQNAYFELVDGRKLERDYIPIFDHEVYLGHLWVYKDLSHHYELQQQLTEAHDTLEKISITDHLTGLGNRRYLEQSMSYHQALSERHQQPFSIAMVDLDDFKQINDQYGHGIGDHVLQQFADFLQENTRDSDILARFGGEEFIILMPNTRTAEADQQISRLLEKINSTQLAGLSVTFSAGIAEHNSPQSTQKTLSYADRALYQVKTSGKNRVLSASA